MADKNLHDIKIDDLDQQKKTPLKNILTLLALLFIILVISVVITKLILNTEDETSSDSNLTTSEVSIPSDNGALTTATGAAVAGAAAAAITTTNDVTTGTKNTFSTATSSIQAPNITAVLNERNTSSSKTKVALRDHRPVKKEEKKVVVKKSTTHTPKKPTPAKVVKRKETPKKSIASYNLTTGYYIKVGTYRDTTKAEEKVKKTALNYKLIKTKNDKTMTRVLIGPFSDENAAKSHLKNIQTNITSGAYITKVK